MTPKKLKHIAPILASLQAKPSGFTIPDSYFDTLESRVETKLSEAIIPSNKEQNKTLPADYFNTFEDKVFVRLAKEKKNKTFSIKKYWIPVAIAASFVLLFTVYNPFSISNNKEIEEITNWIEDGHLDLDSYQIAEFFNSDLETFEIESNINAETLENYIEDKFTEEAFYN